MTSGDSPESTVCNRAHYIALSGELEAMLRDTVRQGAEDGQFTTAYPEDSTRAVLTMCQAVAQRYRPDGPLSPREIAERYVTIALGAVGHRPRH
jgi:hypothetical protein